MILGRFAIFSETFILNQIASLIERGHEVDIYFDQPGDTSKVHPAVEQYQLLNRTYYIEMPSIAVLTRVRYAKIQYYQAFQL
jgi:colanic acid/amylovoran biosynthesis glycosyltransferase